MKVAVSQENIYRVLQKPVITEKATSLGEGILKSGQSFVFDVVPNATKTQIRHAVEKIFEVKVESVRVHNIKGKKRNLRHRSGGSRTGVRSTQRRAYVSLAEGHDIDFLKLSGGEVPE